MAAIVFSSTKVSSGALSSFALGLLHKELRLADSSHYQTYRVTRVVHYKEKTAIGHEFCALYLSNGNGEEVVVRIERRPSTRKVASSSEFITDDSISSMDPDFNPEDFYHISTTVCSEQRRLTVFDMCQICAIIREVAPTYSIGKGRHCYWFCAAFLDRLRTMGYTTAPIQEGKDFQRRGCFKGIKLISEKSIKKRFTAIGHIPPYLWALEGEFVGHTGAVASLYFTPDGRRIVSGSADTTIRVFDAGSGVEVRQLKGHPRPITSIALSPDGRRVASVLSEDNTVWMWDLQAGVPTPEPLVGHTDWVHSVAFSLDGSKLVSVSHDKSVRIWDAETGAAVGRPLLGHTHWVTSVAWSRDEGRVVSGSLDTTIRVWNTHTGTLVGEPLCGHAYGVTAFAFSPDGTRVVSGSGDKTMLVWDLATGRALGEPLRGHTAVMWSVAYSPDGRWIASGSRDNTVRIWNGEPSAGGDREIARLDVGCIVNSVAWSPSGDQVAAGCDDGKIRVWRRI